MQTLAWSDHHSRATQNTFVKSTISVFMHSQGGSAYNFMQIYF